MYQHEVFVPFALGDPGGVVFFGHAFSLAHQAYEQFVVQTLGISWNDWFHNRKWVVPIYQTQATYHKPIYAGDNLKITLSVKSIRTSSFELEYQMVQKENHCCQLQTIHVFCDKLSQSKIPIPEEVSGLLARNSVFQPN